MLSKGQLDEYERAGAIVVTDVLSEHEIQGLRTVTDALVQRGHAITDHDDISDLEDTHTPEQPRVRRIKAPHLHDPTYGRLPKILAVLADLWGPNIRFDTAKLNLKSAGFGAAVE